MAPVRTNNRRGPASASILLATAVLAACSPSGRAPDAGTPDSPLPGSEYVGTWTRGSDESRSIIAIFRKEDDLLFRWTQRTRSANWQVECGWDGHCEEFVDGEKMGDHYFESWLDEETGHLMVECNVEVFKPRELRSHFVDELVVEEEGTTLWSYTVERDGRRFPPGERPRRRFQKTSDNVAHPPR